MYDQRIFTKSYQYIIEQERQIKQVKQSLINKKEEYKKLQLLGQGIDGKVYAVLRGQTQYALKQMSVQNFDLLSKFFTGIYFQLCHGETPYVLNLKDIFLEIDESQQKGYSLNIVTELVESDLSHMLKKIQPKPLGFFEFLPLLRETIQGLVFMHMKNQAHRDIKPGNIMVMKGESQKNKYVLADYNFGVNLNYQAEYTPEENKIQVGTWRPCGTSAYMDPIIKRQCAIKKYAKYRCKNLKYDLFKSDIYSLGLTLYSAATGQKIRVQGINNSRLSEKICYNTLHQLQLPIQIRQLIFHMIRYDSWERISTFSLFQNLKEILKSLEKTLFLTQNHLTTQKYTHLENQIGYHKLEKWFQQDVIQGKFKYSRFKQQNNKKPTFYAGNLKIEYEANEKPSEKKKILEDGMIVLIKPNFLLGAFNEMTKKDVCSVNLLGSYEEFNLKDVLLVKLPVFKENQQLEIYNEELDHWQLCQVVSNTNQYQIKLQHNENVTVELTQNTLKLRAVEFHKGLEYIDQVENYEYQIISQDEVPLLAYNKDIINFNQLSQVDLKSTELLKDYLFNIKQRDYSYLQPIMNVYLDDKEDLQYLQKQYLYKQKLVSNVGLPEDQNMEISFNNFQYFTLLNRIRDKFHMSKPIMNGFLKNGEHDFICEIQSPIEEEGMINIFEYLSSKDLKVFNLSIKYAVLQSKGFKRAFTRFLRSQNCLKEFSFKIGNSIPLCWDTFSYLPQFIKNKVQMLKNLTKFEISLVYESEQMINELALEINKALFQRGIQFKAEIRVANLKESNLLTIK